MGIIVLMTGFGEPAIPNCKSVSYLSGKGYNKTQYQMIKLEHVSRSYGNVRAVDNISFCVEKGETVALIGKSGCGKTTTLRMINRLIEPTSGNITINGKDIDDQPAESLRQGIGYVLQHHGLFPHYTVAENIAIVPRLQKWEKKRIAKRISELLDKLQLSERVADLYPSALSGGQQQRVGLARALASDPPLLLMDEPFGALDPVTRAGIRREFARLDELNRKSILIVTHDVQEAFELGDKVCLMNEGKIMQMGTPKQLLFNPENEFVSAFFTEQRFQLELKAISIKDVWPLLPKAIDGTDEKTISPASSLWETLEEISNGDNLHWKRFISCTVDEKKQIEIGSLMAAYSQLKNSAKDG